MLLYQTGTWTCYFSILCNSQIRPADIPAPIRQHVVPATAVCASISNNLFNAHRAHRCLGRCFLGVDCDVQTARPNPSAGGWDADVLYTAWVPWFPTCAANPAGPNGVLVNPVMRFDPGNTPFECTGWCDDQGYIYAGTQDGDQCWCSSALNFTNEVGEPLASECNYPCAGSFTSSCGAYERIKLYYK